VVVKTRRVANGPHGAQRNTLAARRHFALSTSGLCIPMVEPAALDAIFAKAHWAFVYS
jgi:hypothetical protein